MKSLYTGLVAFGLSSTALAQDECRSLMDSVTEISIALDEAELDKAAAVTEQARRDLMCQPEPVNNLVLTQLYHFSGAVHLFQDNEQAAWEAFGFSASVSPMASLNPILGKEAEETHEAIRQSVIAAPPGQLQLSGDAEVWLDGKTVPVGVAVDVTVGQHFLQWKTTGGEMQNRIIRVESGEARAIPVGPGAESFQTESFGEGGASLEAKHWVLIGGSVAAVTGGVLIALGAKAKSDYDNATDPNELEPLKNKANLLFTAGGITAGVGVGSLIAGPIFLHDGSPGIGLHWSW